MSTKLNPGPFDCYAKLAPDEEYFTLRAKDPVAPHFVELWRLVRAGVSTRLLIESLLRIEMAWLASGRPKLALDSPKSVEAATCEDAMLAWVAKQRKEGV